MTNKQGDAQSPVTQKDLLHLYTKLLSGDRSKPFTVEDVHNYFRFSYNLNIIYYREYTDTDVKILTNDIVSALINKFNKEMPWLA